MAQTIRAELRCAAKELSDRGLRVGATALLELLSAVAPDARTVASPPPLAHPESDADADAYALAKSYFDGREFARSAHALDRVYAPGGAPATPRGFPPRAFFLRCYALFLDGERRREVEKSEGGSGDALSARSALGGNPHLHALHAEVSQYLEALVLLSPGGASAPAGAPRLRVHAFARADAFLAYLWGVTSKALSRRDDAREALAAAASAWPLNWSAWVDLASCCDTKADVDAILISGGFAQRAEGGAGGATAAAAGEVTAVPGAHWAAVLFQGSAYLDTQARSAALRALAPLSALFPTAPLLKSLVARCLYGLRRFDPSQALLEGLRADDPHRIDDADTLSNILYVRGVRAPLAALAADVWRADRYRPESCIAVGNFYSLRGEHDKAAVSFRRALRIDARCAAAWTLLGHEFVELRNVPAAAEAYRRAVDADARDYRAWYGLGQAYELLELPLYASHYFKRAASLCPRDARMWVALGMCFAKLERRADAIACLERAELEAQQSSEGGSSGASLKLGRLYRECGDAAAACRAYATFVQTSAGDGGSHPPGDVSEALLFLARTSAGEGRLGAAEAFALRVIALPNAGGDEREARALLLELRAAAAEAEAEAGGAAASPEASGRPGDNFLGSPDAMELSG